MFAKLVDIELFEAMKNKAKYRIKYYVSVFYPVFSENFHKKDYLCRGVLKENRRLCGVGGVFGIRMKSVLRLYSRSEKGNG